MDYFLSTLAAGQSIFVLVVFSFIWRFTQQMDNELIGGQHYGCVGICLMSCGMSPL